MANDSFITPEPIPEGYERELLTILMEECAEVIQRASKILRFGVKETQPGHDHDNAYRLGLEIGDVYTMFEYAEHAGIIDPVGIFYGRRNKVKQLDRYMQHKRDL